MIIRIDPQSSEPVFEQIAFAVKRAVARGEGAGGRQAAFGARARTRTRHHPNTVVRAYELLERDGIIIAVRARAAF